MMSRLDEFNQHRSALLGLAYRMLGSVMDAEDVLQEAFLRWQQADQASIKAPKAYLMTVVTRLCIDQLRLAYVQREAYTGAWLPEPLMQAPDDDPATSSELADTLSTAFLVLLERLTPQARAILLLHEVFGHSYEEISEIINRSTADCRQIAHRAKTRLSGGQPRFTATREQAEAVTRQFIHACNHGDMPGLLATLAPDITIWSDSGGKVKAARNPILGADRVVRFLLGIRRKVANPPVMKLVWIGGELAAIEYEAGHPIRINTFNIVDNRIQTIYRVLNPDKLQGIPDLSSPEL